MATHSKTCDWRIPWTEEPGGLQSMGSQSDMTKRLTLVGVKWYLTVVLIFIFLMTNKQLFINNLLAICISSLEITSIQILCSFLWLGLLVFLLCSSKSSLHILDTRTWSDTRFTNIFSHYADCLHFLDNVFWGKMKFFLLLQSYPDFLLLHVTLMSNLRISSQIQGHEDLSLCFF